ncbi:hypothetical protein [Paraburkholderia sp. 22B1P]
MRAYLRSIAVGVAVLLAYSAAATLIDGAASHSARCSVVHCT